MEENWGPAPSRARRDSARTGWSAAKERQDSPKTHLGTEDAHAAPNFPGNPTIKPPGKRERVQNKPTTNQAKRRESRRPQYTKWRTARKHYADGDHT